MLFPDTVMQVFKIAIFLSLAASPWIVQGVEDPPQNAGQAGASQPPGGTSVPVTCSAPPASSVSVTTVVQPVSVPPVVVSSQTDAPPAPMMDPATMMEMETRWQEFQQFLQFQRMRTMVPGSTASSTPAVSSLVCLCFCYKGLGYR